MGFRAFRGASDGLVTPLLTPPFVEEAP